ncbi:MAG TPA: sulfatase-like hydrolase/transferase, partial [Clostridia bacterium]
MKKLLSKLKVYNVYNNYIIVLSCLILNIIALAVFYLTLKVKVSFFGFFTDVLFLTAIYFLINLIKNVKAKKIVYTIFSILIAFALMADSTYFYQYKSFASISSLMFVNNVVGQKYGINFPLTCYLLSPIFIVSLFIIWYTKISITEKKTKSAKANIAMSLAAVILCASINVPYSIYNIVKAKSYNDYVAEYVHSNSYLYNDLYSSVKFVQVFGYCNFRIRDAASLDMKLDYESIEELDSYFNSIVYTKQANDWTQKYKDYNVITILCETFDERFSDPEYLGNQLVNNTSLHRNKDAQLDPVLVGNTVASLLTPNIYKIRQKALTLTNYYVPTFFEGATINTEFMVNNGIYALNVKNFSSNLGDTYYNNYFGKYSLAAQFEKNGYETFYFHNDSENFYNRKTLTANEGFDNTYFDEDLIAAGVKEEKIYDTRLLKFFELDEVEHSLDTLKKDNKSFFMQIDTYSMHMGNEAKYDHHEAQVRKAFEKAGINYDKVPAQIQCYYLKMVEFDTFLGMLIEKLDNLGILDKTLIIPFP